MITQSVTVTEKCASNIIIGRRGTYETEEVVFDVSYLVESYGAGTAALLVKRPQDTTAYPATILQSGNTVTWVISNVDTVYKGHGECELYWYVDSGLAKSIIWDITILRDVGDTIDSPPDPYETWIDSLTELGSETSAAAIAAQEAQTAAETAQEKAEAAQTAAETAQGIAEDAQEDAEAQALKAEGFAVGEQNGVPVQSGSPYFMNNAEFYADVAAQAASNAGWVYFYIDEDGYLHYVKTENCDLDFYIDDDGYLHVTNGGGQ